MAACTSSGHSPRRQSRRAVLAALGAASLGLALVGAPTHTSARQDMTMPPGSAGITPQPLGGGMPSIAPGYAMGLLRLTFEPGATLNQHTHPGVSILFIESGTLTYTLVEGTATVTRAATGMATPGAAPVSEPVPAGDIVLNVGDSLFEDADVIHTAQNDGAEPALVLIANLLAAGEPVTTFLEGTPAP
jgi:quercetin dioxygenase-like cupin family protein